MKVKEEHYLALIGIPATLLFVADFVALIMVNDNITRFFLGVAFLFGCIKFYLGSKGLKRFQYSAQGLNVEYYKQRTETHIRSSRRRIRN